MPLEEVKKQLKDMAGTVHTAVRSIVGGNEADNASRNVDNAPSTTKKSTPAERGKAVAPRRKSSEPAAAAEPALLTARSRSKQRQRIEHANDARKRAHAAASASGLVPEERPAALVPELHAVTTTAPTSAAPAGNDEGIVYDTAEQTVTAFLDDVAGKQVSGVWEEYQELKGWNASPCITDAFDAHMGDNRYKDVPCIEWSRVRLPPGPGAPPPSTSGAPAEWTDYVHANYVHDAWQSPSAVKYICAQGPMEHTTNDFWRMVWHDKAVCIIMLCQLREQGKDKCAPYWPLETAQSMTFGALRVTCTQAQTPFELDKHDRTEIILYTKLVVDVIGSSGERHELTHFQWTSWPDKSVPTSAKACVMLAKHMPRYAGKTCIIHCSAGIGRTGTLLMLCHIIQRIVHKRSIDVPDLLKEIRRQRWNSVQTGAQYMFVYRAVLQFLVDHPDYSAIIKKHRGASKFMSEYDHAMQRQ